MNRYFEEIPATDATVVVFPEATLGPNGDTRWRNVLLHGGPGRP